MAENTKTAASSAATTSNPSVGSHQGAAAPKRARITLIGGIIMVVIGLVAWGDQLINGLVTTDMNSLFIWGLAIAIFAFLAGLATGGLLVASVIILMNKTHLMRYATFGALLGLGAGVGGAIAILVDVGNISNVMDMIIGGSTTSMLFWDMLCLTALIIVSLIASYLLLAPYAYRADKTARLHPWVKKYDNIEAVQKKIRPHLKRTAVVGIVIAVLLQLVEGGIFSVQAARPWWNSPIVPVDFLAVAGICGTVLCMLVGALFVGKKGFQEQGKALGGFAKVAGIVIIIHLVLALAELALIASEGALGAMILNELGNNAILYGAELLLPLIAAVLFLLPSTRKNRAALITGSVLALVGIFAHRMMLLFPAFNVIPLTVGTTANGTLWEVPVSTGMYTSGQTTFTTAWAYMPALGEWGVILLPIGIAVVVIGLAGLLYPSFATYSGSKK